MPGVELIGAEIGETTFPIDRSKIAELAAAVKDPNPSYSREGLAVADGAGVPAPLNWPVLIGHWSDPTAMRRVLKLDPKRVLHGGVEWEYVAPVTDGDTITGKQRVADVTQREGKRGGHMTLIAIETVFTNQRGELVAREVSTIIETRR